MPLELATTAALTLLLQAVGPLHSCTEPVQRHPYASQHAAGSKQQLSDQVFRLGMPPQLSYGERHPCLLSGAL